MKESSMSVSGAEKQLDALLPHLGPVIAIACSGGPDSMALTLLAAEWAKKKKGKMIALTVDHGLRKESAEEAKQVGKWLKRRHISHEILRWEGRKPKSNLQEAARNARYALLAHYCKQHGIKHLLVAHTLEDQAETFLLRLRRGSGVDGLSAMAEKKQLHGVTLIRPLLATRKAALLAYLKTKKQPYISDPSNKNSAYDRVKIRQFLPELEALGLSAERLAKTAASMARARKFLENETEAFMKQHCVIYPEGYAWLKEFPESDEIALRVLAKLLMIIGNQEVRPRLEELERLYQQAKSLKFKNTTLGGCIFKKDYKLLVIREPKAVDNSVVVKKAGMILWDRFEVHIPITSDYLTVGPLTQEGWLELVRKYKLESKYPDKRILYTLPVVRDKGGKIIAVPHLGIGNNS